MSLEEKRAWIRLVVGVVAYVAYVVIVLTGADGRALTEVPYAATLLWSVIGAIVAAIVAEIMISAVNSRASRLKDERDRQIGRLGDITGQSFVVIGALVAMLMAMAEWDPFWIANAVYLCFVLSLVLGSVAKLAAYRGSFPQW
jgi:drug/metabolite transporter (DMT)-like permease